MTDDRNASDSPTGGQATGASGQIVDALRQALGDRLIAVALFGSRARGDASVHSDWDVLVIARDLPTSLFKRHLHIKRRLPAEWRGQLSLITKTRNEFESNLPSLLLDIALDGIILCDTDGYLESRLARIRRLISERGLERVSAAGGMTWRWKEYPGPGWALTWDDAA